MNIEAKEVKQNQAERVTLALKKTVIGSSKQVKKLRLKKEFAAKIFPYSEKEGKILDKISFALAFPEYGDMDVPGKQLLDGGMFCVGKLREQYKNSTSGFSFAGNVVQIGDEGITELKKVAENASIIIGETGVEFLLHSLSDPVLGKKLHFFPIDGSSIIRAKKHQTAIFYRPSYKQELKALVDYVTNVKMYEKVAILYESGFWGSALYEELLGILKDRGITPLTAARYQQNSVEVDRALKNISEVSPNVVFCLAKPRPAYKFIKGAVDYGMHSTMFVGPSPLLSIQHLLKNSRGIDLVTISVVPPETGDLELIIEYKKFFGERFSFKRSNPFYLESYLYMKLLFTALAEVPAASKNPDLLIKYFESLKDKKILGLPLSFDLESRSLATKLWIVPGSEQLWREVLLNPQIA